MAWLLVIVCAWIIVQAAGVDPNIDYTAPNCGPTTQPQKPDITYGAIPGEDLSTSVPPANISVKPQSGNVNWSLDGSTFPTNGCKGDSSTDNCGIDATHPNPIFQITAPTGDVSPATPAGQVLIRNSPSTTMGRSCFGR